MSRMNHESFSVTLITRQISDVPKNFSRTLHYLNQCWLIISNVHRHSPESHFIRYAHQLKPKHVFKDYNFEITIIFVCGWITKSWYMYHVSGYVELLALLRVPLMKRYRPEEVLAEIDGSKSHRGWNRFEKKYEHGNIYVRALYMRQIERVRNRYMFILPVMKDHLFWKTTKFSGGFIQVFTVLKYNTIMILQYKIL